VETTDQSDEQLIAEAAREGSDGLAYTALVHRHRERVWRICYRLMGDEHDAHDAAQEVFVRLFFHRGKFAGRSKFTTWLHGLAVRTCLTLRRGRGRRRRRESTVAEGTLEQQPDPHSGPHAVLALEVMQLLEGLGEEDRAMLILKYAEGYSYEELAEMFELSVSACKMRVSRARDKVQELQHKRDRRDQ
jgi:RNA polymerase sigma-70 factor (ECF subfamily)